MIELKGILTKNTKLKRTDSRLGNKPKDLNAYSKDQKCHEKEVKIHGEGNGGLGCLLLEEGLLLHLFAQFLPACMFIHLLDVIRGHLIIHSSNICYYICIAVIILMNYVENENDEKA